jgi:hypothetical protein
MEVHCSAWMWGAPPLLRGFRKPHSAACYRIWRPISSKRMRRRRRRDSSGSVAGSPKAAFFEGAISHAPRNEIAWNCSLGACMARISGAIPHSAIPVADCRSGSCWGLRPVQRLHLGLRASHSWDTLQSRGRRTTSCFFECRCKRGRHPHQIGESSGYFGLTLQRLCTGAVGHR